MLVMPRNLFILRISVLLKEKNFLAREYEAPLASAGTCIMGGGGGGGGSLGRTGVVIFSLKDCETPILPSLVDPGVEKDCRASFSEGLAMSLSLVVSWNIMLCRG